MTLRVAFVALLTIGLASSARAANPVGLSVAPNGDVTVTLAGRAVASGRVSLRSDSYLSSPDAAAVMPGTLVRSTGHQETKTRATIHQTFATATADFTLDLDGEDLRVTAHVVNTDRAHPLKPIAFIGPMFHFDPAATVTGELNSWHYTYLQAQGVNLFHPSVASPVGCWWAKDEHFAFSVHSESEFERSFLATAEYPGHDGLIPPDCQLDIFTDRAVPPGGAVDVDWSIRISSDMSIPHMLEPYKAIYDRRFPLPMYTPDNRGVAMFCEADKVHVSRNNPLGFHGPWCRFDTAFGTAAYVQQYADADREAGLAGCIFWAPCGYRAPMYPPDFDVMPPAVAANLPALMKGFHDRGLRVGLCARPGDGVTREPGKEPVVYRLSADDPEQMRVLDERFRHAIAMGFDMFYLDSIGGGGSNDVRIVRHIRDVVSPDVALYGEYCTDMDLPYAGRYCEWSPPGHIFWTSNGAREALRLLCPDAPWICRSRTNEPFPSAFAGLHLNLLILNQDLHRVRGLLRRQPEPSDR